MRKGFTLIEVLIATTIFTLVIVAFIAIFITVVGVQTMQTSAASVNEESEALLQKIQYYIELSSYISSTQDLSTSTLTLRMPSSTIDPTVLSLANGTVYLQQASGTLQPLSDNKVVVSNLLFTRRENTPGHDAVNVSFTVSYNTSNIKQMVSQALQTSVAEVSAATFDSNLLPAATTGQTLGASGNMWSSVNNVIYFAAGGYDNVGVDVASPNTAYPLALQVNGGLQLSTAISQPACNSATRGTLWFAEVASPGTATDTLQICYENSASAYNWFKIL